MKSNRSFSLIAATAIVATGASALATAPSSRSANLSLRGSYSQTDTALAPVSLQNDGASHSDGLVLSGPYFLRSADPEELGEMELKFIYGFETSSNDSDEHEFEFVMEWGIAEDVEFILEVPFVLGDGKVEGSGDITEFGLHIRHWRESGDMPAFATRHLVRFPTGYHSDGVDYLGRAIFTKTLVQDSVRLHFNPFIKSVNGNLDLDTRHFQWGAAIGFDLQATDDLVLIADYQNLSSENKGTGNQQLLELGADWTIAEGQKLGFQTEFELDGDEDGNDFGFRISYILQIDGPSLAY